MKAFCDCARELKWKAGLALCKCGIINEPQTQEEFDARKRQHEQKIAKLLTANRDLELT